jgi:hypothetical protein
MKFISWIRWIGWGSHWTTDCWDPFSRALEQSNKHSPIISIDCPPPAVSDWVDSLIGPRGLLLSSLQPTCIPVSVPWVGLGKSYAPVFTRGVKAKVELKSRIPIGANHWKAVLKCFTLGVKAEKENNFFLIYHFMALWSRGRKINKLIKNLKNIFFFFILIIF